MGKNKLSKNIKSEAKIIIEYPKARLETCGQRKTKYEDSHLNGCYLKLSDKDVEHSSDSMWIIVDFDKDNCLTGIEFVEGIKYKPKLKKNGR